MVDVHVYQLYTQADVARTPQQHDAFTREHWAAKLRRLQRHRLVVVGEWSAALHTSTWQGVDDAAKMAALRSYAQAQVSRPAWPFAAPNGSIMNHATAYMNHKLASPPGGFPSAFNRGSPREPSI